MHIGLRYINSMGEIFKLIYDDALLCDVIRARSNCSFSAHMLAHMEVLHIILLK